MKNIILLYFKFFTLVYILSFNLSSCNNDDKGSNLSGQQQNLTQIMYSTNDIKALNLYSPNSFKFYPWTINTTVYAGVSFPDNTTVQVNSDLSWSSSNENIIKPVNGIIVALNEGKATLSAKWSVVNLSASSELTVALPDSSVEDYKNWQFNDISITNNDVAASFHQETNTTTLYWNDPYYLTTSYIIAYSSVEPPLDCTTQKENKTIIELDLSQNDLQGDGVEIDPELKEASMYHYTLGDLNRSIENYFIMCKKQTLAITKNNKKIFSISRMTPGGSDSRFYLPIINND